MTVALERKDFSNFMFELISETLVSSHGAFFGVLVIFSWNWKGERS